MTEKRMLNSYRLYFPAIALLVLLSCEPPRPQLSCANGSSVRVPAKPDDWRTEIFTPTKIQIQKGDSIVFAASGTWYLGLGAMGPDGKDDLCECTISEPVGKGFRGPLGALIGRVGKNGKPFLVGSRNTITADEAGMLYLTTNENMGPCNGVDRGSCYDDNEAAIDVCVEVKK